MNDFLKRDDGFLNIAKTSDSFALHKSTYEHKEELEPLRKFLQTKRYTVGDSTASYRVMSTWAEADLLPEGVSNNGWRRFSLVEIVWVEAIKRLRYFGLTFKQTAHVKHAILTWYEPEQRYPMFEFYVSQALMTVRDIYIVVKENGADIGSSEDIEIAKTFNRVDNLLLISIKSILKDLNLYPVKGERLFSLNEDELKTIMAIRNGAFDKDIELKVTKSGVERISTIESVDPKLWDDFESKLKKDGEYASITTEIVDGKKVSVKVKRRKRT